METQEGLTVFNVRHVFVNQGDKSVNIESIVEHEYYF